MNSHLLEVDDLTITFPRSSTPALNKVSFSLDKGERLGLIGESGSGKSLTALAIIGLLAREARCQGHIRWKGDELIGLDDRSYSSLRGSHISMVFQEPMTALDPTMSVGRQVAEVVRLHQGAPLGQARERVCEMLTQVGLKDPQRICDSYIHQLSGGQRQRVLIAMALINSPELIICDEPTTALDVTVQARVLHRLTQGLQRTQAALLFISHDLAVVSHMCDHIAVMYRGSIVESGPTHEILNNPQHGYTAGLIATADLASYEAGSRLPVLEDFWTGE